MVKRMVKNLRIIKMLEPEQWLSYRNSFLVKKQRKKLVF